MQSLVLFEKNVFRLLASNYKVNTQSLSFELHELQKRKLTRLREDAA